MDNIIFDAENHIYYLDGKPIPSVTTILNWKFNSMANIPIKNLEKARVRGTAVHKAIEDLENTGDYELPAEYQGYMDAYIGLKKMYGVEITSVETMVYYNNDLLDYAYAGTRDNTFNYEGKQCSGDNKTSAKLDVELVALQLSAYAIAEKQMTGITFAENRAFWIQKNGNYKFKKLENKETEWLAILGEYYINGGYKEWITTIANRK